jgi:hypothetical protein
MGISGFGRKASVAHENSIDWPQPFFTERVHKFWEWFSGNEERIAAFAENPGQSSQEDADAFVGFLSEGVGLISENIHFNIGGDHEFTLAVSGDDYLHYLLPYIVALMPPEYEGKWHFFAGMQGTNGENFGLRMHGADASAEDMLVSMQFEEGANKADLRFFCESTAELEDNEAYGFFYILLENIIGESLSYTCVGKVDRAAAKEPEMFPLIELEAKLKDFLLEGKDAPNPAQMYFVYQIDGNADDPMPRADVFIGRGCYGWLINAYYKGENNCFDAFADCGATPVFLYWDIDADRADSLAERNEIEDRLIEVALSEDDPSRAGIVLGAAMGQVRAYIDILLYDPSDFWGKAKPILEDYSFKITMMAFKQRGNSITLN